MTIKRAIGKVHLWLGFSSGAIVLFLGVTGCILAFQQEIEMLTLPAQFTATSDRPVLPPTAFVESAENALPGKKLHGVAYGLPGKSVIASFYDDEPEYFYQAYLNPYTAEVIQVKNMDEDFFRTVLDGHFYLWLKPEIGQPIVASATLVFVIMMISGLILWWPKRITTVPQRFRVKWNARWRRINYDLHNVLGFYMTWVAIFIAVTGLVWGFQWFSTSLYWITSGGKTMTEFYLPTSTFSSATRVEPAINVLWSRMVKKFPDAALLEVHIPESDSSAIEVAVNPDQGTYWKTDYLYFDQYTLEEKPVHHAYGRFADTSIADKIMRMNYDVHVGAIWGLPGKIIAFLASLICASLPVTGVYIWWGRRVKANSSLL